LRWAFRLFDAFATGARLPQISFLVGVSGTGLACALDFVLASVPAPGRGSAKKNGSPL
jgi:hypothetical protein